MLVNHKNPKILEKKLKKKNLMVKKIQRSFFRYQQLKSLNRLFKAIRRIQTLYKVKNEYKKFKNTQKKIKIIQKFFKHKIFKRKLNELFLNISKQRESVTKISSFYKMKLKSRLFKKMKKSANIIKKSYINYLKNKIIKIRKFCEEIVKKNVFDKAWNKIKFKIETVASIIIQKYARTYLTKTKFWKIVQKIKMRKFFYSL